MGLIFNCPGTVPEPDKEIVRLALAASEVTVIPPLALPPLLGAKDTPKVKLCPGTRVIGTLRPVMLKSLPVTVAALILTSVPPVLVKVSGWLPLLPT